jgi:hypothetical protein
MPLGNTEYISGTIYIRVQGREDVGRSTSAVHCGNVGCFLCAVNAKRPTQRYIEHLSYG